MRAVCTEKREKTAYLFPCIKAAPHRLRSENGIGGGGPFETDPAFELSEKNPYLRSINIRYGYQEKQFGKKPAGYLPFQP